MIFSVSIVGKIEADSFRGWSVPALKYGAQQCGTQEIEFLPGGFDGVLYTPREREKEISQK